MVLAVSILSSDYNEEETINRINKTNADYIHVDVMDGKFVIEKTKPYEYLYLSNKPLQVHLMVSNPFEYISKYNLSNTESIIFPVELDENIDELLDYITNLNKKCGLALNPETPIERVLPYINKLDYILILTVHPGKGGQQMIGDVLPKIDELNKLKYKYSFNIIIDGGVNDSTIDLVKNSDIVVSGSYICKSDNYQDKINKLHLK